MSQRRSNRGRSNGPQFQPAPQPSRQPDVVNTPAEQVYPALPAPGTATAVASGAAGPPRPVLPYDAGENDRDERDEREDQGRHDPRTLLVARGSDHGSGHG